MKLNFLFLFIVVFLIGDVFSQGIAIMPVSGRYQKELVKIPNAVKYTITDTIPLPFFDDFTATSGYPSLNRWCDNQVWVNNTFPTNQPNYNVATFDHLNANGKPYSTLNKNDFVYADSLTSIPIKLDFYKTGPSSTANYQVTDSIYLSFFVERMGLGDMPEEEDSLVLFFKSKTGNWNRVWWMTGGSKSEFQLYTVPVNNFDFLHAAFQFRFVNYTKSTGNLNHWHLDYVGLEKYKGKKGGYDFNNLSDIGIVKPKYSYINNYFSMPKSHYLTNPSGFSNSSDPLIIRNLYNTQTSQTRFTRKTYNQNNTLVDSIPDNNGQNANNNSFYTYNYANVHIDSFAGTGNCYTVVHEIFPQDQNETPDNYDAEGNNNKISVTHCFTPWYAYDDGSAEGGIGLDYAFLGNIRGQFAMKFENVKEDSLRGLGIFFNRSESDVSFRSFYVRIWKALSPLGSPDDKDQLIYEQYVDHPLYTDSVNHFSYIFFDTTLLMPKGAYYVGWRQNAPFILNVGYDNNYRYQDQETGNPNLFYNLLGSWEANDPSVKGTPMIRPLFGAEKEYTFGIKKSSKTTFVIYPNPAGRIVRWEGAKPVVAAALYDMNGRLLCNHSGTEIHEMEIENVPAGTYILTLTAADGQITRNKLIRNP
ncbi:MAG: T9SS type A sorting domain-containing protein [Bacteroidetes bacterium]|nr:T9SS type A sorting domain-containing protein [Bacteroidota bacterium]